MIYLRRFPPRLMSLILACILFNSLSADNSNDMNSTSDNEVFVPTTRRASCDDGCNLKIGCSPSCDSCSCDFFASNDAVCSTNCASSRTYFLPRALTPNQALDLSLGNYYFYHHTQCPEDRAFFQIQASYFHMGSTKEYELAAYFNPNARRCISVREDGTGDVGSLWLGLVGAPGASFNSILCLSPRRSVNGGFFNFYFDFNSWLCGSWLSIAFAAFKADHCIGLRESEVCNPGVLCDITNATQALNNPNWTAGKISPRRLSRTGVDDVQFKLGWNYYFCNFDHVGFYFVATAPTGCRSRNEYLFEPQVGSRHGSVGVGLNTDYTVWDCEYQAVHWMVDLKYRYVLSHCERRLFDLCENGPWSRYLAVVTPENRSMPMPGVNFFAQNVDVTPKSTIDFWTCLHYNYCEWNFEVGYDLFWRDCEKLCLNCPSDLCVGIYDLNGDCLGNPVSASCAQICQTIASAGTNVAPSDATFVNVTTNDFNLLSGTAPSALSHTIYGALSYNSEVWCLPVMLGVVGGFEVARCNTTFQEWFVMVKGAMSF